MAGGIEERGAGEVIVPSDREYHEAKAYKLGRRRMVAPYSTLAEWVAEEYHVSPPLQIRLDPPNGQGLDRYRLDVVFDTTAEASAFNAQDGLSFDSKRQNAVASRFKALVGPAVTKQSFLGKLLRFDRFPSLSDADLADLFVIFSAFEDVARIEANHAVSEEDLERMAAELGLWKVHALFGGVTFMFATDAEALEAQHNGRAARCRECYADALRPHDEFGYFEQNPIFSKCDSRETFERDYEGSWFLYTR